MPVLQPINLNDGIELKSFKKDAKSATHNHIAIGHNKHVNNGNRLQPGEPYPFGISRTKFHRRGKRDKKRLLQIEVFNFLEKPRSAVSVLYHSVV